MPPRSDLDQVGQFYEGQLEAAWDLFHEDKFAAANVSASGKVINKEHADLAFAQAIAKKFLLEPDISNLHAAGFHLLLAHSPDQYVYVEFSNCALSSLTCVHSEHAERALSLYKGLYQGRMSVFDDGHGPTAKQLASKKIMIKGAEQVLAKARADAILYLDNSNDEEVVKAAIAAQDEEDERLEAMEEAEAAAAAAEAEAAIQKTAAAASVAADVDEDAEMLDQGDGIITAPLLNTTPPESLSQSQSQRDPQTLQASVEDDEDEPDLSAYLKTPRRSRGGML